MNHTPPSLLPAHPPGAVVLPAASIRGTHERRDSAWLGRSDPPSPAFERYRDLDRLLLSSIGHWTGGLSVTTRANALFDWWVHLAASPAKQLELLQWSVDIAPHLLEVWLRPQGRATTPAHARIEPRPLPQDKRFSARAWQDWPFSAWAQSFLAVQQAWHMATEGVPGVNRHHEEMVAFGARQLLDMLAPSNSIATNPVVLERTLDERGANLLRGARHAAEDVWREALELPPAGAEAFKVGVNVAATPGQVILRNRLAELIQYTPTTPQVRPEPVLLVPAWIMKYYILDLSAHNSLVRALVDQGFTVFVLSWKNPEPRDRDIGMADYFHLGVEAALDAIERVQPFAPVHAAGYCLGGTLLAMAAAALAPRRPQAFASLTLLAAQTDFTDPGELGLFIDEGQVELLVDMMWRHGVLHARQMKGTFQMLRSQDLVWSYRLVNYLLGERQAPSDLMAWNADGTRLPYRMHKEYLHTLFLDNALARGEACLDGEPVNLAHIRMPVFNVGTLQDHVAPWRSVYKLHMLTDAEQTFCLTAGGHNAGIINPPQQARTSHRLRLWRSGDPLLTPDQWLEKTPLTEGSWWTPWFDWLHARSGPWRHPPTMGAPEQGLPPLQAAPGRHVLAP
ncbi:alpha/beta fold hydrolase [Sphaerotilus montanus]|uniref:Polyhydroxyalkanoate synthase n=1 Tax=Sphaerotilus montanus TaxID=522889 RepID=A0A7Y9R4Y4_9BURK|nr:alpha/beta fold hydrolase [Sphaerotilus montanus]NYG35330.1 polyhydroxyalkanoate synthase [Sphaerotilus montanus]NZD56874.1 alpha/beta fold hydrolase [Sphaerotilus montanus]